MITLVFISTQLSEQKALTRATFLLSFLAKSVAPAALHSPAFFIMPIPGTINRHWRPNKSKKKKKKSDRGSFDIHFWPRYVRDDSILSPMIC